jgi:Domain of unknown function (DU1801)
MQQQDAAAAGQEAWSRLLEGCDPDVRMLAIEAQKLLRAVLPDAQEEVDIAARLLGFTYRPGSYRCLIAGIIVHSHHLNIMLSSGAELAEKDEPGLLEGTGKRARHIKITSPERLNDPRVERLITAAAALTPHS